MSKINYKKLTIWCLFTSIFAHSFIYGHAQSPYISAQSGAWNVASTWVGGNVPPSALAPNDSIHIGSGHSVVHTGNLGNDASSDLKFNIAGTLTITGNLIAKSDMVVTIQVDGTLNLISVVAGLKSTITIDIDGTANITDSLKLGNNSVVIVNGLLDIGGHVDVQNGSILQGSGNVSIGGSCEDGNSTFCSEGPLPVELLYFYAAQTGNEILLEWSTASELNNDFFTIENSRDGRTFDVLATIQGNGTVNSTIDYQFTDTDPYLGLSYYRLSQTDYDGTTEQFPMISVLHTPQEKKLSIYPNPIRGGNMQLSSSGKMENELVTLRITNLQGRLIMEQSLTADAFGNIDQEINLQNLIRRNTYIVELISRSHKEIIKVLGE